MSSDICQWAIDNNISMPQCHKDFCACVKKGNRLYKERQRQRNSKILQNCHSKLKSMGVNFKVTKGKGCVIINDYVTYNIFDNSFIFNSSPKVYTLGNKKKSYEFIKRIFKL